MRATGGFSGANMPVARPGARNSVAWPPTSIAASRSAAPGVLVHSQRCAPPHSMSCSPDSLSGGVVAGTDSRQSDAPAATALAAPTKNSS